jgi:hypothetical protein
MAMPTAEERARGGAKRYRTVSLPGGKYLHVAIVPKAGPRGGHTVAGPVRKSRRTRSPLLSEA